MINIKIKEKEEGEEEEEENKRGWWQIQEHQGARQDEGRQSHTQPWGRPWRT